MEIIVEDTKVIRKLCECGPGFYQRVSQPSIIFNIFNIDSKLYYQCIYTDGSISLRAVEIGLHSNAKVIPLTLKKVVFEQ